MRGFRKRQQLDIQNKMPCFGNKKRKRREENDETITVLGNDQDVKHRPASASQVCPVVPEINERQSAALQVCPDVPEIDQSSQQYKLHERCINRQKASDSKVDELEANIQRLEKDIEEKNEEMAKMTEENLKTTAAKTKEHQRIAEKLQAKISRQRIEIQELTDIKNELLTRLSAMASAKLTDGNANIADLSDENRPTKLAERYSELYDNEWTDAYEVLTAGEDVSEQEACHILLEALCSVYSTCNTKANDDRENITGAVKNFLGVKEAPTELMKHLKDQRKKNYDGHIKQLKKDLKESLQTLLTERKTRRDKRMKQFLNKGIELCWLMVIQDPPVFLDVHINNICGEKYDNNTLKPYTQSGHYIDYIVWPPLYLTEGGNILCKGIAQFKSEVTVDRPSNESPIITRTIEMKNTPKIEEDSMTSQETTNTMLKEKARRQKKKTPTPKNRLSAEISMNESINKVDPRPDEQYGSNSKTISEDSITSQETTNTTQKEKGRRQKKETPTSNNQLSSDTSMYESSAKVDPRRDEEYGSNSRTISEANPSANRKGKMSNNTSSTTDANCTEDLKPSTSSSNTIVEVRSSADQTSGQTSDQVLENSESQIKDTITKL